MPKLTVIMAGWSWCELCVVRGGDAVHVAVYRDHVAHTRLYRNGVLELEGFPLEDISEHLADPTAVVWADLVGPTESDFALIGDELNLHGLAIEDAVKARQRPKLDRYPSHLFIASYCVELNRETGELGLAEVSAFVTRQALITVRHDERFDMDAVVALWDSSPDLAKYAVSFLLYGLLDVVVDTHFAVVQMLDEEIEDLEEMLFDDRPRPAEVQRRSFEMRKSLVLARRVVLPMREVVNSLMRRDLKVVDEAMLPYYQDVYDHVLRAAEWTDSLRDLVSTILETNLTIQGNRLNAIMKKVTGWAAIIAVPTAVTGFYGQNVPYPGYGNAFGFWTSLVIMVGLSGGLYWLFKARDWL